jgi:hypothetical protein
VTSAIGASLCSIIGIPSSGLNALFLAIQVFDALSGVTEITGFLLALLSAPRDVVRAASTTEHWCAETI